MQHLHIFVDEFGNTHLNLEKTGTFSHFVLTAVLIEEAKLAQARKLRSAISQRYFQGHPIQSSRMPNDETGFQMRLDILQELRQLDFLVLSLVINKSKVAGEGLGQQDIFYKYFNRIFLKAISAELYRLFHSCRSGGLARVPARAYSIISIPKLFNGICSPPTGLTSW